MPEDELTTRQCFSGVHDQCKRAACQCACHDVRTRYRNDVVFHRQVDAISHEVVLNTWQGDQSERMHAVRVAKEAIVLWLERFGR